MTLEIYAGVLKRRDRSRHGIALDVLMRDAIPSMQQAKMYNRGQLSLADDGLQRLEIAA